MNTCRRCGKPFRGGVCPACDALPYDKQWWKHDAPARDGGLPPLPKAGESWGFRRIGEALPQRLPDGRRQVRWEDQTCSHTDNPDVLALADGGRFECQCNYVYTGVGFDTGPAVLTDVKPLPPLVRDPVAEKALWDRVMGNTLPDSETGWE